MTATDELRRLLTDAGVEYGGSDAVVYFEDERGYKACAYDAPRRYGKGVLCVSHTATPEQAIAATLGRGECHITDNGPWGYPYVCSACGASFDPDVNNGEFNYCPNCGRKVVDG